jgi:hypothetical protein
LFSSCQDTIARAPPDVTRDRGSCRPRRDLKGAAYQDAGSGLLSWIQGSSGQVRGGLQPVGQVLDRRTATPQVRLYRVIRMKSARARAPWRISFSVRAGDHSRALCAYFLAKKLLYIGCVCSRCTLRLF